MSRDGLREARVPRESRSAFFGRPGRPVVVGGCPRSGTTLVRAMLNSHPELAMPRETRFVIEAWLRRKEFGDFRLLANRESLARWIFEDKKTHHRKLGLDSEAAVERLKAAPPTLGSLLGMCFVMYAEKHGKARWGDKRPMYAAQMQVVWDLFPEAQFINVIRDPRACVASMRRLGWYRGHVAPAAELWERSIKTVNAWRGRLAHDHVIDVRYEELVTDPETSAARMAAFLGLASDEAAIEQMLNYHERKERRSARYHANLSRPPDPALVSAWTDSLKPAQVAFVEHVLGPLMERYGYECVAPGVAPPAKLLRAFRHRRRRQAAARRKLALRDRFMRSVTYRHPLAAELPAALTPRTAVDEIPSRG